MKINCAPVILVVDDDRFALRRVARGFLRDTSLGVLCADSLPQAATYLRDQNLQIDAILADIGFDRGTQSPEDDLLDGLDLIRFSHRERPDLLVYGILSVMADDRLFHRRAAHTKTEVDLWFPKLAVVSSPELPWMRIENLCLAKLLKRNSGIREAAEKIGLKLRELGSDEALAKAIQKTLVFPRLTYIQELPDNFEVIRPIEVLCEQEGKKWYRASAISIGLVQAGHGETVEEAIENLGALLVSEVTLLRSGKLKTAGYAAHVKDMLGRFIRPSKGSRL